MFRVLGILPINWLILFAYVICLFRLSLSFRAFYANYPLGTTVLTNVLLFGLSDTLAQSLRSAAEYKQRTSELADNDPQSAIFRYVLDHGRHKQVWLDEEGDDLAELGLTRTRTTEDDGNVPFSMNSEAASLTTNGWYEFNYRRLGLFSLWGFMVSFIQSPWYGFLRTAYAHDARLIVVVQRVLADQLIYSPVMLALFLFYLSVMVEQRPWTVIGESSFWTSYVRTISVNLCVWPAAQFVNFLIIPSAAQIPFSSGLSVLWNTYLSLNTG